MVYGADGKEDGIMNRQQHGLISFLMVCLAAIIGCTAIAQSSILLAILYLCIVALCGLVILYSYCCKCPCRLTSCAHLIPGRLTTVLPRRMVGKYALVDFIGFAVPMIIIILFPQYWLVKKVPYLVAFWLLIIIAIADSYSVVCIGCENRFCPLREVEMSFEREEKK